MSIISVNEAAALLGVTDTAIKYAIRTGRLQATKVGRRWHIDTETFRAYQQERKTGVSQTAKRGSTPRMLNTKEVSQRLGCSTEEVRRRIYAHQINARQIGRDWLIAPDDLAEFEKTKHDLRETPPGMLSPKDAAKRLHLSQNRIYELIKNGTLRAQRIGTHQIIDEESLLACERKRRLGANPTNR